MHYLNINGILGQCIQIATKGIIRSFYCSYTYFLSDRISKQKILV